MSGSEVQPNHCITGCITDWPIALTSFHQVFCLDVSLVFRLYGSQTVRPAVWLPVWHDLRLSGRLFNCLFGMLSDCQAVCLAACLACSQTVRPSETACLACSQTVRLAVWLPVWYALMQSVQLLIDGQMSE